MPGVLCSGSIVLDVLVRPVDALPWGGTALVDSIEQHLGGNGSNTAYTLGILGTRVRLLGMVGRDDFAEVVLAKLRTAGVDTTSVQRSWAPTAGTVVMVRANGDRAFLHRFGASAEAFLTPEDLAREFSAGYAHYHLGSPFGLPRLRPHQASILRQAQAAGLTTSIDTHWDSLGRWLEDLGPCLPHTDILFVNQDEARMLTGTGEPAQAAARLRDRGARTVALKLGATGCAVFGPEGDFRCPAFEVPVVDTTGAGDCFAGAFLAALDRGAPLLDAARLANAAGALAIQKLGAVEGLRSYQETVEWMRTAAVRNAAATEL